MTNSSGQLGNVISRLQGLKHVRGRSVMPGAEFLENLGYENPDVAGTAQKLPNFSNFVPPTQNQPEADLGGELTPQSYDVRANEVIPSQEENVGANLRKLGTNLWNSFKEGWTPGVSNETRQQLGIKSTDQAPPIETEQVESQEGLSPVTSSEQQYKGPKAPEPSSGIFGSIADYFSPTKRSEMSEYNQELNQNSQLQAQGKNPTEVRAQIHENLGKEVEKAMEQPWQYAAYGSASEVANNPALKAEFKTITGIDYEPQISAQVEQHESAMKGVEDSLNGINTQLDTQSEAIKQRILNNQSTDADKFYIGLALLMPLIIGGFFGKEAALGALGGGAKGIADVLAGRQKGIREDEASLLDINKQKGSNIEKLANIGAERAKFEPALRKAVPESATPHLLGMQEKTWVDPATGKEEKGVEVKPGLIARPQFLTTKEGLTDMRKAANELSTVKNFVKEVDDLTQDISEIVSQLKDPSKAWKGLTSIMKDKVPGVLSAMTEDVMFDGRKQNAGTLLEEKLGFLANAYGMAKEIGQLDRAAQQHIKKIIDNPTSTLLTPRDALNQVLEVRKLAQKGLIESASNQGFYPEFIIADLESRNNELFGGLNKKENDKRLAERKLQALQSETNYAK